MTTRAGHWKNERCDIYVGRGSPWGNPYVAIGKAARSKYDVIEVADPIAAYELHLRDSPQLLAKLPALRDKVLGCYCVFSFTPQPFPGMETCHAQVLVRYADRDAAPKPTLREELAAAKWVMPPDFDRSKQAPPHPVFDGPPTFTLAEWWRAR